MMSSGERPKNFHVVLASRPGEESAAQESNFRYEETAYPDSPLQEGCLLVRNLYLSLDPALRCRLNSDTGVEYVGPWEVDKTAEGFAGIGTVVDSKAEGFDAGDLIIAQFVWPWMIYFNIETANVTKISPGLSPTLQLTVLGLTGLTAYLGIKEQGHIKKGDNQTVVISAAAGSTGSFAGQIAKVMGCGQLVGICGSDVKVNCLVEELGFDSALNYKTEVVHQRLAELCPQGIDIYFDNVGGDISDEVIRQMNEDSHIILCGQIASYNKTTEYPPPLSDEITDILKSKNITRDRFLVLAYRDQWESATKSLLELYQSGKIKVKETIETGLENAGKAFVSMMKGGNIGKQLLKV